MSSTPSAADLVKKLLGLPQCPSSLLILAADTTRRARITTLLQDKFLGKHAQDAISRLRGSELDRPAVRRLRDESLSGSLFCASRFFIIDEIDKVRSDEQKQLLAIIEELAAHAHSDITLILRAASLPTNNAIYKFYLRTNLLIALPEIEGPELTRWVHKELKQNGIETASEGTVATLIEIGGQNADEISKLCEHAALYVDGATLTTEDLYKVFVSKISADEFKLLELLTQGRLGQAEALLSSLMREGKNAFLLMGLLARNFHTYLSIQHLIEQRKSPSEIGQLLNIPGWLLKKHLSAVQRYRVASLKRAIESILKTDSKLKNRSVGHDALLSELASHLSLAQ